MSRFQESFNDATPHSSNRPANAKRPGGIAGHLLHRLLKRHGKLPLRIVLPDGESISLSEVRPIGTIEIQDNQTVLGLIMDPIFQFGEAYAKGKIEIRGDLIECLTVIYRLMYLNEINTRGRRFWSGLRRPHPNSLQCSQKNVHHHYDIGNDFYRLWLDKNMVYTCAYFARPDFTLEQAQFAKMEHVCRKLQLKPGMEVVEAGCGWGALSLHMAGRYGVRVRAFNLSTEQIELARETASRTGLARQVEFVKDDWRNIRGKYDAFVSVGMLEHVGINNYELLGRTIHGCLRPSGSGLIHSIGQNTPRPMNPWMERRIFPGAYPPTLQQMMQIFEPAKLSVLDVENMRLHYVDTLRHWLCRFDDSIDEIRSRFDERFVRMWRLYLAGSAAAFACGRLQLFQIVFASAISNRVPRTREHLYDVDYADFKTCG